MLVCFDDLAAERVENNLLSGSKVQLNITMHRERLGSATTEVGKSNAPRNCSPPIFTGSVHDVA
jgi:hypothetical protein